MEEKNNRSQGDFYIPDNGMGKILAFQGQQGLTKREYFAGLAMQGMISNPQIIRPKEDEQGFIDFTERAVRYADELLKQLEQ